MNTCRESTKTQPTTLHADAKHRRAARDGSPSTIRLWLRGALALYPPTD